MIKDSVYIQGLIDYIVDVKPFSSKLVDVAIEYLFDDQLNVSLTDKHTIQTELGSVWSTEFSYDGKTLNYQLPIGGLSDDIFISFDNFNDKGVDSPNSVGAVFNNPTRFVPYKKNIHGTSSGGDDPDGVGNNTWGGSFNADPNATPVIPDGVEDPTDYLNGIPNFDIQNWDGNGISQPYTIVEYVDDTKLVNTYLTDVYGYEYPQVTIEAGRNGVLIGTLTQKNASNGNYYYVFEFNKAYLDTFVPVGTMVKVVTSQRKGMSSFVSAKFSEQLQWGQHEALAENVFLKQSTGSDAIYGIYDEAGYDTSGYDVPYDPLLLSSAMYEQLSVQSVPVVGTEKTEIVSSSIPSAKSGYVLIADVTDVTTVIINHFFGDTDPNGQHADHGGVIVQIDGPEPLSITNPYAGNTPALFNSTKIVFSAPTTATIRITKP